MRAARLVVLAIAIVGTSPSSAAAEGQAASLPSGTDVALADVAFRPDGALALAVGGAPGQGVVVRIADGQASVARADAHRYLAVAWSPRGEALVVGDGAVLRTRDGARFDALALPPGLASFDGRAVAWKPDGSEALLGGSALLRYTAADGALALVRASADEAYGAAAWAPDGGSALVEQSRRDGAAWTTGRVLTWDGSALRHVATFGAGNHLVEGIAWSPSGGALVFGFDPASGQGPVMGWDGAALSPAFTKPAGRYTALAWRPGGSTALLAGAGGDSLAETDGATARTLRTDGPELLGVAWHPSGQRALLVGAGGALLEWLPEGRPQAWFAAPLAGTPVAGRFDVAVRAQPRPGHELASVEARLDGGAWQALERLPGETLWRGSLDAAGLADGTHFLEARARDDGASSDVARITVRVGAAPPPAWGAGKAPVTPEPPAPTAQADGLAGENGPPGSAKSVPAWELAALVTSGWAAARLAARRR